MTRRPTWKKVVLGVLGLLLALVLLLAAAAVYQWRTGVPATAPVTEVEARYGAYSALTPAQRRLVDDWVERVGAAIGTPGAPRDLYDALPLSTRTTFDAVTHALSRTTLSDRGGQPLNLTALDLVTKIDAVAGTAPGKRGDQQFRLYVQLRPDARQTLERSRELTRHGDNTVYHRGYPICFRGSSGTPSIQFSLSQDGTRGDIDVDYRASAFPIMLLNGHLTASNSDVRAGNNDARHNGQWSGLWNWWRGFMGLALADLARADSIQIPGAPSIEPRMGKGAKPEEAIADFLSAWLVEQNPGVAVGYIARRAYSCLELERGVPVDRGVARFQIARAMASVNERLGKVGRLADAIGPVTLSGERTKEMPQPFRDAFAMYDVREDLAAAFDCERTLHPEGADPAREQSTRFGEYVGAVFRIESADLKGEAVATLWAQENDRWMLVAYDVEPEVRPGTLPTAPAGPPDAAVPAIEGDPNMIRAARAFFEAWFVRHDTAAAFSHLSPRSVSCYDVYRPEDAPAAGSPEQAGRSIRERMKTVYEWAGASTRLDQALAAVDPHHVDLKLVKHDAAAAFSIVAVPDAMGAAADCGRLQRGGTPRFDGGAPKTYGRFYATSTRLRRAGPEAAALWTVWAREGRTWRIVSFLVLAP